MSQSEYAAQIVEINRLRTKQSAIILAHNYQNDEIQDLADYVGDSLALSQIAASTTAEVVVFCGVHFMAESAAILSPGKTVLLPDETAGCPMAEMAEVDEVLKWREQYPRAVVVSYVNSTAAVKAVSDYCCTSANAVKLVQNIPEQEIIFLPDQNLGRYVAAKVPQKQFHIWPGYCITHQRIVPDDVIAAKQHHPDALVLVHPECRSEVGQKADFIGSTSQIMKYVKGSPEKEFIIGTEMGIIHGLQKENPLKKFYLLSPGLICPNMKRITIPKVLTALQEQKTVIKVSQPIQLQAKKSLDRMLKYI